MNYLKKNKPMKIESLAFSINSLDWGYEMSDSYAVFDKWDPIKNLIAQALANLTDEELGILQSKLDERGDANMKRYFSAFICDPLNLKDCQGEITINDNNE